MIKHYTLLLTLAMAFMTATSAMSEGDKSMTQPLSEKELCVVDLGAAVARGDQSALAKALNRGFDSGMTLAEAKEYVGQLYAYCGFPRALNAAATLMSVVDQRQSAGKPVPEGVAPSPLPTSPALVFGTENQTKLCGAPVKGPLFEFIPQ